MKPQVARTLATLALAGAVLFLLQELIVPILWAALIAVATWPLRQRWVRGAGSRQRAGHALLLTGLVMLLLVVPVAYVVLRGWREVPALLHLWATSQEGGVPAPWWLAGVPGVGPWLATQWNETLGAPGALSGYVHTLLSRIDFATGRTLVAVVAHHAMAFFFCLFVLFFLYLDGAALAAQIDTVVTRQLGPAGRRTLAVVERSIRGAVNGLVLVGLGVAVLMTVAYLVAGVPHPALLGLATGLVGMVPFGALVVVALVVLYLFSIGAMTAAIVLAGAAAVAIFIADHFIRPALMAGSTQLPFVLALLGIIGGLETFGVLGLFLGPTLLAVAAAVWRELAAPALPQAAG